MMSQLIVVIVGVMLSLALAGLVGNTLVARLEREKKLTERDVTALTTFQDTYGDFFALWKEWGNSSHDPATVARLLPAAAKVEGKYEALLVMLCSERTLTDDDRLSLGALRQGFQQLREAMKARENLQWWSPYAPEYRALKSLTAYVAVLLRPRVMGWAGKSPQRPEAAQAAEALTRVTSNEFENRWVGVAEELNERRGLSHVPRRTGAEVAESSS